MLGVHHWVRFFGSYMSEVPPSNVENSMTSSAKKEAVPTVYWGLGVAQF